MRGASKQVLSRRSFVVRAGALVGLLGWSSLLEACAPTTPGGQGGQAAPTKPTSPSQPAPTAAGASAAPTTAASTAQPTTVRHWVYLDYPDDPFFKNLVDEFNSSQKNVTVEFEVIPFAELRTKLSTAIATGTAPDVATLITHWLGEVKRADWAEPLDPFVDRWSGRADIWDGVLDFGRPKPGDPLLYIPWLVAPPIIFYRKDWLAELGMAEPPKTHDELMDVIQKVNDPPNRYGWGMRGDAVGFWYWVPFLKQNGVELVTLDGEVDLDSQAAIDTTDWYLDIARRLKAAQPTAVTDGFAGIFAAFTAGKLMFAQHSTLLAPTASQVPNAAPMALPRGKVRSWAPVVTTGNAILRVSKHKDAAWEWLTWFNEPAQMKRWTLTKEWSVPLRTSLLSDPAYDNDYFKVGLSQQPFSAFPSWHPYWGQWQDQDFKPAWQEALSGQLSTRDMLTRFATAFRKHA